jgi:hypothetical protein
MLFVSQGNQEFQLVDHSGVSGGLTVSMKHSRWGEYTIADA